RLRSAAFAPLGHGAMPWTGTVHDVKPFFTPLRTQGGCTHDATSRTVRTDHAPARPPTGRDEPPREGSKYVPRADGDGGEPATRHERGDRGVGGVVARAGVRQPRPA